MNKVFLVGRLAADPILKTTSKGSDVCNISLAVSDNRNKDETYFFPCIAWTSTATYINTYLKKGDMVTVDGRLTRRSYVSKDGKQVYTTEIVIESISVISKAKNVENAEFNKIYSDTIESPKSENMASITEALEGMKGDNE